MAGRIDRRAARTRNALHRALIDLILRKGYEATTVQDIIDEADVGRSTFYAHYSGKEDLLRGGFERLRALLEDQPGSAAGQGVPLGFSRAVFEHACEYRQVYRALVGGRGGMVAVNELRRVLAERVRLALPDAPDETVPRKLRVQFVTGAFLSVLTWALERKPDLAPAETDAMFRGLVLDGIGTGAA